MIFLATPVGPDILSAWVCDCRNTFLDEEIEETRADASPDASIAISFSAFEIVDEMPCTPELAPAVLSFYCPN